MRPQQVLHRKQKRDASCGAALGGLATVPCCTAWAEQVDASGVPRHASVAAADVPVVVDTPVEAG